MIIAWTKSLSCLFVLFEKMAFVWLFYNGGGQKSKFPILLKENGKNDCACSAV